MCSNAIRVPFGKLLPVLHVVLFLANLAKYYRSHVGAPSGSSSSCQYFFFPSSFKMLYRKQPFSVTTSFKTKLKGSVYHGTAAFATLLSSSNGWADSEENGFIVSHCRK